MEMWESAADLAYRIKDYGDKHSYTDWEAEQLEQIYQDLLGLSVVMEDKFKQAGRSAGGLTNKVRDMGETIKKLEERLEELESELTEAKTR